MGVFEWILGTRNRLYEDPDLPGVKINEVPDNKVKPDVLGLVEFDRNKITVPNFSNIVSKVNDYVKQKYVETAEGLKNYIKNHEKIEYVLRPSDPDAHARMDAGYLSHSLDEWGTILHYIGLETGRKFTEQVNKYFPVKKAYNALKKVYGSEEIEDRADTVRTLVGRKEIPYSHSWDGLNLATDIIGDYKRYR